MSQVQPNLGLAELVRRFRANEAFYTSAAYLESDARSEFIDPLLSRLGWDMENRAGLDPRVREVLREETLPNEAKGPKRPDYTFRTHGVRRLHAEAKRPGVDIATDADSAFQCRSYGWSAGHPVTLLTNFRTTAVYDTTVQPRAGDDADVALVARFDAGELVARFDELAAYVGREAVSRAALVPARTAIPVNRQFLERIRSWRVRLAQDLLGRHPDIGLTECNDISQKLINRIIFIRMCEDRGIERPDTLRGCLAEDTFEGLLRLFLRLDERYNAGLFSVADDALRGGISLSPAVLSDMIEDVLAPRSPYSFAVLDAEFLGQVYEAFLLERLCLSPGGAVGLEPKPAYEGRDVVSTPQPVVDAVVKRTISNLLRDLAADSPGAPAVEQILDLRILDFAVGSGRFILSAFNELCSAALAALKQAGTVERLLPLSDGQFALGYDVKRDIATRCLWGIDIDYNAVEIAKFTLLVRLLEDENGNTLPVGKCILPNVDANIICGNSIVDAADYPHADLDGATLPLDWAARGLPAEFDAVIGNPPYMKTEDMRRLNAAEFNYLKGRVGRNPRYRSAFKQFDKYLIFLERALSKTRVSGWCGFVVPNKWINIEAAQGLRTTLVELACGTEIVDFGSEQLFDGRDTYVCILLLSKGRGDFARYQLASDPARFFRGEDGTGFDNRLDAIRDGGLGAPWLLAGSGTERAVLDIMMASPGRLRDIATINNGVQTSAEKVFAFLPVREEDGCYVFGDPANPSRVECEVTRPYLKDSEGVKLFHPLRTQHRVIYPYEHRDGRLVPITPDRMREAFPNAWMHLVRNRVALDARDVQPRPPEGAFYAYGRHQALESSSARPKIVYSVNQKGGKYALDEEGVLFASGGTAGEVSINLLADSEHSYEFLLGLLAYPLTEFFLRKRGSPFRGGYYARGSAVMSDLPIPALNFGVHTHCTGHGAVTDAVRELTKLHRTLLSATGRARQTAQNGIDLHRSRLLSELDALWGIPTSMRKAIVLPGA